MATVAHAGSGPSLLSLNGSLFDAAGHPLVVTAVTFHVEIWDQADSCRLYFEDHPNQDLSQSQGRFALTLGTGTGAQNLVSGGTQLGPELFTNSGALAPFPGCPTPPVMAAGAARNIHVSYDLGSGLTALTPAVTLTSNAHAMVADTLQGKAATDFLQVNATTGSSLSQSNVEYAFSAANWTRLKALVDGTSTQYLPLTPANPVDFNGQRLTDVADPTGTQDAATKKYVDTTLSGHAIDVSGVGPATGDGRAVLWDATANKWVTGQPAAAGPAGGDLTGTYPNPSIANAAVTTGKLADGAVSAAKIDAAHVAVSRLVISDATTGAGLTFATCPQDGILAFDVATGWTCRTVGALAPVTSVAGKTGAVGLNANDVAGLGTAALLDYGTAAQNVVRLDALARVPAVDGSQLTNLSASALRGRTLANVAPSADQVLGWNATATVWEPRSLALTNGDITAVIADQGLVGGGTSGDVTLRVDYGNAANQIVRENANAQIAQAAGSATIPAYAFAGDAQTGAYSPGVGALGLVTAGVERVRVTSTGFLGLGTVAPAATLEIDGATGTTLKIVDGTQGAGKVLTSNAQGVASWVTPPGTGTVNAGAANQLAYFGAAGTAVSGLGTLANGVLVTNGSGAPAWTALSTDTFTQYALLAGRGAGQNLSGGTAASGTLTLDSTTNATKGAVLLSPAGGNVGIGTSSPTARLEVAGSVVSRTNVVASGAVVNLALGNTHLVRAPGGALLTLQNPVDGGSYTIIVTDTSNSRTYTFAGCTNQYFSPSNGPTVVGARSTYTVLVVNDAGNTDCYVSWVTGFM